MKAAENYRYQQHAQPVLAPDNLGPPVDETLQHVLLDQSPAKTQDQLGDDWPAGVPAQKIYFTAKQPARQKARQRGHKHWQDQKLSRLEKIIQAKSKVTQCFTSQPVRADDENKSQTDRNRYDGF